MSRSLPYPDSVHIFSAARAETQADRAAARRAAWPQLRAARRRRRISSRPIRRGARAGSTSACCTPASTARAGHDPYAPCTVADLARYGYDYWALGHIHAAEIVARDPWVVYPGNLQGRSPRETGAKGAMRVTVEDGRIVAVEPVALDAARWAHESVDVSGVADESETLDADRRRAGARPRRRRRPTARRAPHLDRRDPGARAPRRPPRATRRRTRAPAASRSAPIAGSSGSKIATAPPPSAPSIAEPDALDVDALIAAAAADPEFAAAIAELAARVAGKAAAALARATCAALDDARRAGARLPQRASADEARAARPSRPTAASPTARSSFAPDAALHVVLGRNEAGKTTALQRDRRSAVRLPAAHRLTASRTTMTRCASAARSASPTARA